MMKILNIFGKYHYILRKKIISFQPTFVKRIQARKYWEKKSYNKEDGSAYDIAMGHKFNEALRVLDKSFELSSMQSVLEFGCNRPLNLSYLAEKNNFSELIGIDISHNVFEITERLKTSNYKPLLGDIKILNGFKNDAVDFSFTWSVLDHIPDKKEVISIIENLIRVSKKHCFFIEPYIEGVETDASLKSRGEIKQDLEFKHKTFYKYSYFWNYMEIFNNLGIQPIIFDLPLHKHSLGPFYKIFFIKK